MVFMIFVAEKKIVQDICRRHRAELKAAGRPITASVKEVGHAHPLSTRPLGVF